MVHQSPGFKEPLDCFDPDKQVGHITFEDNFTRFIGPDREPVKLDNIQDFVAVADIISKTGKPNYQLARIPISSNLNVQAW